MLEIPELRLPRLAAAIGSAPSRARMRPILAWTLMLLAAGIATSATATTTLVAFGGDSALVTTSETSGGACLGCGTSGAGPDTLVTHDATVPDIGGAMGGSSIYSLTFSESTTPGTQFDAATLSLSTQVSASSSITGTHTCTPPGGGGCVETVTANSTAGISAGVPFTFQVDVPTSVSIVGMAVLSSSTTYRILLTGTSTVLEFGSAVVGGATPGPFSGSAVLDAGTYTLSTFVRATSTTKIDESDSVVGDGLASATFEFDFDLVTIPEPTPATLLGTGLMALAVRRRRPRAG